MAFTDPQSVTINAVPVSLPRVGFGANSGAFSSADGLVTESVQHSFGKRTRHTVQLTQAKLAADPYATGVFQRVGMTARLIVDTPVNGFTAAEQKYVVDALLAQLSATSGALIVKVIGGES